MSSAKCLLFLLLVVLLTYQAHAYYWNRWPMYRYNDPCNGGFRLNFRNRYGRMMAYPCGPWRNCPMPWYFRCRSWDGSDDGVGICCYEPGGDV